MQQKAFSARLPWNAITKCIADHQKEEEGNGEDCC